jgi:DNA-binding GntR family transcriptional regulator
MSDKLANGDVASFTEKAYQAILGAIARLELKPGETLTQDRLAKWLAISRTPVREALRRLEQDGLIQNVPGRGLIVTELTIKDVEDLLELLCILDTQAAYLAAQRRTPEQAEELAAIAQALLLAAEQHDVEAWSRIDKPYHDLLLEAAGNHFLRRSIEDVRRRLQRITYHVAIQPEHMLSGTREHVALAQAISESNAQAAADIMRQHLQTVATQAMQLVRTYIVPVRGARF